VGGEKYKIDLTPQPPSLLGKGESTPLHIRGEVWREVLYLIVPSYLCLRENEKFPQKKLMLKNLAISSL
jgi:surface polysaccharide O-acyltransferase-like enzyme